MLSYQFDLNIYSKQINVSPKSSSGGYKIVCNSSFYYPDEPSGVIAVAKGVYRG